TIIALDGSITGLELIKSGSSDNTTIAALEFNINSLKTMKNATQNQMLDTQKEIIDLDNLSITLNNFSMTLANYSDTLNNAKSLNKTAEMENALDNISRIMGKLNVSFDNAKTQITALKSLLSEIKKTSSQIDKTLDIVLNQTNRVDTLIGSLQTTVAEQTEKDPNVIASPLSVKLENQYTRTTFVDFIMPQIISISLLLSCFLLGSISLVKEKSRKTIVRALMAPGALPELIIGKIISLVVLSFGQIVIIILVAMLFFGVKTPENPTMLVWGIAISSLVLSSIGILIGFYAKTESAAIQSCLLLAIPMLFLGNIIFSPDLLPNYTQVLQQVLPLSHVTSIFKIVLITNGNPALDIGALLSYFVILAAIIFVIMRRKEITNYA
ncbi:ABC transporter permease, partial [Candidatus Micrarchaeota archaeon]|nr:ABC transporter permease [Candidatus Micrarchaeota archaeon]